MVLAKSKNAVGLGNSLMNDRFGRGKGADRKKVSHAGGIVREGPSGETYVTNSAKEASWVKMRSVTEQGALDEFLSTAELAGTDFTAEKTNSVKIIHSDQLNPYLLSAAEERRSRNKQAKNKGRLTVPRRPKWNENTTPQQLDEQERANLLDWRRGLAEMQEIEDLLMTPFERNIEVWRQLWRVIERSNLVVQIVDARNPLLFRSEDLERYVKEVDSMKRNLLLVNKADMMTQKQREAWASYFKEKSISFKFFSAHLARESNEILAEEVEIEKDLASKVQQANIKAGDEEQENDWSDEEGSEDVSGEEANGEVQDQHVEDDTRIITIDELESLFLQSSPKDVGGMKKTTIGLVGYPNVGKSSTINALIGAKKVSVSSTPGKTKHFQTIHLSDRVILCDCPGLVFPNFASTKAELVCNGVLPIDQLREFLGPAGLVAQTIPHAFLEAVYGIKIKMRPEEEGGTGVPSASEVLRAYARARGFATTGQGQPDESRAARYILKDYVNGKLLYCHPPPHDPEIEGSEFNRELYDFAHLPSKRQRFILEHDQDTEIGAASAVEPSEASTNIVLLPQELGNKSKQLDQKFFANSTGSAGHLSTPFGRQKQLTGRKEKSVIAMEKGVDPSHVLLGGKKHFKGRKQKVKSSNKAGEDDD